MRSAPRGDGAPAHNSTAMGVDALRAQAGAAAKRGDWAAALEHWRAAWAASDGRSSPAAAGMIDSQLQLGQVAQARAFVAGLAGTALSERGRIAATALLHRRLSEWGAVATLLGDAFGARDPADWPDRPLLRSYVKALVATGRADEALALIDRTQGWTTPAETDLAAAAVAASTDPAAAAERLLVRIEDQDASAVSSRSIGWTMSLLRARRGPDAAVALLDRIEQGAGRADLVLAVEALHQRRRLDALAALRDGQADAAPSPFTPPIERAVARLLDGPAQDGPLPRLLAEGCDALARARARLPAFLPDPLHDAAEAAAVARRVAEAIARRAPFMLLRLGDGEGVMLPAPPGQSAQVAADRRRLELTWWGGGGTADGTGADVAAQLAAAIRDADIVGVTDLLNLTRSLATAAAQPDPPGATVRGRLAVLHHAADRVTMPDGPLLCPDQTVTSAHIHQAFAFWGLWDRLLPWIGTLSLVTCHGGLAAAMAARWGVRIRQAILVPPEARGADGLAAPLAGRSHPALFEETAERIGRTAAPGEVVLVAAGILGKAYAQRIKRAGGIALDIGAAADVWAGHRGTRPVGGIVDFVMPGATAEDWRRRPAADPLYGLDRRPGD